MTDSAPLVIPTIDIARDPSVVGHEIDEVLRTVGFFQITGHGVPDDIADACWDASAAFFDLPLEAKLEVERAPGGLYGYFPMRTESLAKSRGTDAPGDLKESFNAGPIDPPAHEPVDDDERALFSGNRWPAALPQMRGAWEAYFGAMEALSVRLMSIFALGLDLPEDFFAHRIDGSPGALRAINYPEQQVQPEEGQLRAGAHSDYGTLTILRQQVGRRGLQVHDGASDSWVDVPAVEGAFVINIGDLMARWTNDRWTSTLHRVVNPDVGATVSSRRQSMPFFHNANFSAVIEAIPTCLAPGEQPRYEPVLAGPHLAGKARRSVAGPASALAPGAGSSAMAEDVDPALLPAGLPVPSDDGAAVHLPGRRLPALTLPTTGGRSVHLADLGAGRTVLYAYPMTGRPGTRMPEGWDEIPGARGCSTEACDFRDHFTELRAAGATHVYGLSSQDTTYQQEVVERLALPFEMLSDPHLLLADTLGLPTFVPPGHARLYSRLTLIVAAGRVEHVFYPIFPPDEHAQQVLVWLREHLV